TKKRTARPDDRRDIDPSKVPGIRDEVYRANAACGRIGRAAANAGMAPDEWLAHCKKEDWNPSMFLYPKKPGRQREHRKRYTAA
ncbi:unnamed protein product, partial [marine sediment metagenome]